jgi:tRNA threonylcarbamoyladenosine biosynthesis protein TsaB
MPSDPLAPTVPPGLLLAMDTSGDVCSVALFRDGRLVSELAFRHEMRLSERLISHVDYMLAGEGAGVNDVDRFAVGLGPGSFTGTRIGVMTMKTFAYIRERPLVAFDSLLAMAAEYSGVPGVVVIPVLPCRSGVVYTAAYSSASDSPSALIPPAALTFEQLGQAVTTAGGERLVICGPAARRYEVEIRAALGERPVEVGSVEFPRASALGRLAYMKLASGLVPDSPLSVVPLYISPPPITMPKVPIPT